MPISEPAGDLLADRVNVLVPRDLLARHDQLAGARPEQVVALADRPLHQLRTTVDEIAIVGSRRRRRGRAGARC